jgi:hypothetical protein
MDNIRIIGLLISAALAIYGIAGLWMGRLRRGDLLLALAVALVITVLSISPAAGNFLTELFRLENRLFAILVASTLVLFGLFFFLLTTVNSVRDELSELVRMIARTDYRRTRAVGDNGKTVAIVIPAYKEEATIERVLGSLPVEVLGYAVIPIVVVDGNYDDTEFIVQRLGHRVATHIVNRGQGGALRTGFQIAFEEQADIVVTMDADGQHRADDLPLLIGPVDRGEADYVMGSRFMGEYADRGGTRHIGIVIFSLLISVLTGMRITDCTNGFRAIRADKLKLLDLREERSNAPELIIQAANHKLRILEIPIAILSRAEGESKKPRGLGYPLRFGLAMLKAWLR